jgi:hypothetical protein
MGDALVGIEGKNPIVASDFGRVVLLVAVPSPRPHKNMVRESAGDVSRTIFAATVNDNKLISPRD